MPLYNDPGFSGLAQRFGLRTDGTTTNIAGNANGVGKSFLNSPEGQGGAYSLFSNLTDVGKQRGLANAFQTVFSNYKAAVAQKPDLQFTDFLDNVDPNSIYHSLDFFTRGERPSAYQGRYKFVGGG